MSIGVDLASFSMVLNAYVNKVMQKLMEFVGHVLLSHILTLINLNVFVEIQNNFLVNRNSLVSTALPSQL